MSEKISEQMKRIDKALTSLLLSQPFFATLALRLNLKETEEIPTFATDGENLLVNPKWCSTLKDKEIITVLCHEVLHCFPEKTFVAGCNKFIEDVKIGDKLIDHTGNLQNINIKASREYEGSLFEIKVRGLLPIEMTEEHPVLTMQSKWKTIRKPYKHSIRTYTQPIWKKAKDLKVDDWVMVPKIQGNIEDYVMRFEYENKWSVKKELQDGIKLDLEIAEFLGWYVAEGWTTINKDDSSSSGFALHTKEIAIAEKMRGILERKFGLKSTIKKSNNTDNGIILKFSSAVLGRFLREHCGHGAHNKKIPDFIFYNKNKEILKSFLRGYIGGDGYLTSQIAFGTVSKILASQIQLLSARLDTFFNITAQDNKNETTIRGKKIKRGRIYIGQSSHETMYQLFNTTKNTKRPTVYWKSSNKSIYMPIVEIKERKWKGTVYNFETEKHTYVAGNIITHNCALGHIWRIPKDGNHLIWNLAVDNETNWDLERANEEAVKYNHPAPFPWPSGGHIMEKRFRDMSAEKVYRILEQEVTKVSMKSMMANGKGMGEIIQPKNKAQGEKLKEDWEKAVVQAAKIAQNQKRGHLPGNIEEYIKKLTTNQIDWKNLLRDFLSEISNEDWSFRKANSRYSESDFILPSLFNEKVGELVFAIDTSGSISNHLLAQFLTEAQIALEELHPSNLTVIYCDTKIHSVDDYQPGDQIKEKVYGRGGTDFCPVFEMYEKKEDPPRVLVYLTDLEGQFPSKHPEYPVLWITPLDLKVPFGEKIIIKE